MEYFVEKESVVRKIWGKADTILFIFAGAAAEFALNKAVDWLYFTGRLPADPMGRLFSTVSYARAIVFSNEPDALRAIDAMTAIHSKVETSRGSRIPDWAYRDVLFMLIDYSIRSFELLERKMSLAEKQEVFIVFNKVGKRMGLEGLPSTYKDWVKMRIGHLEQDLEYGHYTKDLFRRYRKNLGTGRYLILLEAQKLVVPKKVSNLMGFRKFSALIPFVGIYKLSRRLHLDRIFKSLLLPSAYKKEIGELDHLPV
ncbi:MAG TPA: oxygenase MpaB family protein [Gillisia sp.]|nr:oxygenase MpaB family protein [Gillisia sp.]